MNCYSCFFISKNVQFFSVEYMGGFASCSYILTDSVEELRLSKCVTVYNASAVMLLN